MLKGSLEQEDAALVNSYVHINRAMEFIKISDRNETSNIRIHNFS
jgi:hypothetical protein